MKEALFSRAKVTGAPNAKGRATKSHAVIMFWPTGLESLEAGCRKVNNVYFCSQNLLT